MIERAGTALLAPEVPWQSRRLWSLWDMINFRFSSIYHLMTELSVLIQTSNHNMEFMQKAGVSEAIALQSTKNTEALEDCRKAAIGCAELARIWLKSLNCIHIDAAAERLKSWGEDNNTLRGWSELNTRSRALRDAVDRELRGYHYYQYPKEKAKSLLSWKEDWENPINAFAQIQLDVFSAVDCFALGHNTAAVFHCMRVLEHGLAALAEYVGLTFDTQQWNTIIEQIESRIGELRTSLPRGVEKNERMQILSEVGKEFFYFKDGCRNYVSHNRGNYDEHQARSVLEHVKTFMTVLAKGLKE